MPQINPDQAFKAPLQDQSAAKPETPNTWFAELGELVPEILKLNAGPKQEFIGHLNRLAGENATYTYKKQLHESLIVIYHALKNPATAKEMKYSVALKILEGVANCAPGFHNRVNDAIGSLSDPANLDDILFVLRKSVVSNAASIALGELEDVNEATEDHTYNRFFTIASQKNYGVPAINQTDVYEGQLKNADVEAKLKKAFDEKYTLFRIVNEVLAQIQELVSSKGYHGKLAEGYNAQDDERKGFSYFDSRLLNPFVGISDDDLFVEEDNEDGITSRIVDINWMNVKKALLTKLRKERYFTFTTEEESLLDALIGGKEDFNGVRLEGASLFSTPEELIQALIFFKEMPNANKLALFSGYINHHASANKVNALLETLEKTPELNKELGSDPYIKDQLLRKAVDDNKLDKVVAYVKNGADINSYLGVLIEKHKNPVLQWLMTDAEVRATITRERLQVIVDKLIHSKKGRQILLSDERLQGFCPEVLAGKSFAEWMQQAREENVIRLREGLFPPSNPLVTQFLQHVIYGEQREAEKMLVDNQRLAQLLLTEKAKVKDYSGRKIYGTALQMALGAEDVGYHEDEICMVEMLQKWMWLIPDGEALMAEQIAEQFPEGYEEQEQQRIKDDEAALIKVLDAIGRSSNDAECEPALQEFDNYLKSKGVIRTGKHFNEKLQEMAYELYDKRYDEFGGWSSRKNNLAWRRVNGRIQRNYTACLAQAASQGFYYIVDEGEKLQRTLELRNDPGVRFYPLDLSPASRLGIDYAIGSWDGVGERGPVPWARARRSEPAGSVARDFQNFVVQKTRSLERLMPQRENHAGWGCAVM